MFYNFFQLSDKVQVFLKLFIFFFFHSVCVCVCVCVWERERGMKIAHLKTNFEIITWYFIKKLNILKVKKSLSFNDSLPDGNSLNIKFEQV